VTPTVTPPLQVDSSGDAGRKFNPLRSIHLNMSITTVPSVPASKPSLQPSLCLEKSGQPKLNVPVSLFSALGKNWTAQRVGISSPLFDVPMSTSGEGFYLLLLSITGYLFAPIHHYYICLNKMVLGSCMCKQEQQCGTCARHYKPHN